MELRPGIALGLAPRFQTPLGWTDRVQINGGVEVDAGRFYPRRDWRRLSTAELALLLADGEADRGSGGTPTSPEREKPRDGMLSRIGLLTLPPHVRRAWWTLAEREEALTRDDPRYRAFVDDVVEFLRFKRVPLPVRCRVDVVVSRPGQPSTRWDEASGRPVGLGFNVEPAAGAARDRVAGVINLGDEPTHLVLLNLAPAAMAAMLGLPTGSTPGGNLLDRFCTAMPTYPVIRVRLEAGDGLWLPSIGVAYDVCTLDKREVDVALTIHDEAERQT